MKRGFDVIAFGAFCALLAITARRGLQLLERPLDVAELLLAAAAGIALTDLISGVVHWLCDTYGSESTPLLGPSLIRPFREHHSDPLAITRGHWIEVNSSNCVGALAVLILALWRGGATPENPGSLFGHALLFFFASAVYLTNTFHRWAHQPRVPALGRGLQRLGLVIGRSHHDRHHATGYGSFCITSGWLNPLLDGAGFFPAAERALAAVRIRPDPARLGRDLRPRQS